MLNQIGFEVWFWFGAIASLGVAFGLGAVYGSFQGSASAYEAGKADGFQEGYSACEDEYEEDAEDLGEESDDNDPPPSGPAAALAA